MVIHRNVKNPNVKDSVNVKPSSPDVVKLINNVAVILDSVSTSTGGMVEAIRNARSSV